MKTASIPDRDSRQPDVTKSKRFRKILIANRGEIAVRLIRACQELDIKAVAVYSEADAASLHVRMADEAYLIGPPPSSESYLRIDRIIDVAHKAGAEAIHPGYGFLAENASFAQAVSDEGMVFIGPSAESMRSLGSKINARSLAAAASVPLVPGTDTPLRSLEEAVAVAAKIGYPVMLKASAGGGGKGMRRVASADALPTAFSTARSEALASFGDSSVFMEKALVNPRHVEIQLLGDHHGNVVSLGERECSLQRRHQKVMEECPSPLNDARLRQAAGEAAVTLAKTANYFNAGTAEFLVDAERNFYFLEMNTRLQVEHPVSELVTGIDLVKEQIRIALGEPLGYSQEEIHLNGHAIECRIYAEDAEANFMPTPGKIRSLSVPDGPGVRNDGGIYEGWNVPIYYDALIAKFSAHGRTREEAIQRLRRSLREYVIGGIKTTIPFFLEVLELPEFQEGRIDTGFIDRWLANRDSAAARDTDEPDTADVLSFVAAYHHLSHQQPDRQIKYESMPAWKRSGRSWYASKS